MCIRDSVHAVLGEQHRDAAFDDQRLGERHQLVALARRHPCLLYTSDAADERSSVDLGGRRIIKKKNRIYTTADDARQTHMSINNNNMNRQRIDNEARR